MKNNYGNYVVQKALKLSSDFNKRRIIELIMKNLDKIGEKKLVMKWRFIIQSDLQQMSQGPMYNYNPGQGQLSFDTPVRFFPTKNISDHY
jgi:hypothetical protein